MKKILVPCDFSDQAVQAFKFAVDVARQSKGEVLLLTVIEVPVVHEAALMPSISFEEVFLKESRERAEKDFAKMKSKWAKDEPTVKTFVEFGNPSAVIRNFIDSKKVDLVVMGTKGASGLKEYLVGSNTEKIVRWSKAPVIAIKKYVKGSSIKNIVFPNTLERSQEDLIMKVKALQNFFNAKLHILYVNTPANFKSDSESKKRLEDFGKRFMFKDYTLNIYNDIYEEGGVLNFAKSVNADMIAIATHGRKGLNHLLSGSIAEDLVNHIECPIWTSVAK